MKAITIKEKGSLENIQYVDQNIVPIEPNQILIKVVACGINPVDYKGVLNGIFAMPYTLGSDISGVVEQVGYEISSFKVGDEIIGSLEWSTQGAFAEYLVTEEKYITLKPKNVSFEKSAAVPLASLTAWQGLFDKLNLQKGQKILIQAAAGGVGLFAVQFAKWKGAFVVAVVSEKNVDFIKSIGADETFDYKNDFLTLNNDFDCIFDSMASSEKTIPLLKKGGKYVSITAKPNDELALTYQIEASNFLFHSNQEQLKQIVELIEEQKIEIFIDQTFLLSEAKKALEYQYNGHSKGKNILIVN